MERKHDASLVKEARSRCLHLAVCALLALTQAGGFLCLSQGKDERTCERKISVSSELHLSRSSTNEVMPNHFLHVFFVTECKEQSRILFFSLCYLVGTLRVSWEKNLY